MCSLLLRFYQRHNLIFGVFELWFLLRRCSEPVTIHSIRINIHSQHKILASEIIIQSPITILSFQLYRTNYQFQPFLCCISFFLLFILLFFREQELYKNINNFFQFLDTISGSRMKYTQQNDCSKVPVSNNRLSIQRMCESKSVCFGSFVIPLIRTCVHCVLCSLSKILSCECE